jgi:hypothetical protein
MKKVLIVVFLFLGSCKSTESINRFARSAASGISELNRNSFGFGTFCKLYDPAALEQMADTSRYAQMTHPAAHCGDYKTSDSLVHLLNQALGNYFALLQAVSDKKLLAYNARPLVTALADLQPRLLPALSFTDEKVTAVKGLLNTLLNEPLKAYRGQKLKKVMRENDTALSLVIRGYQFILDSALRGEIDQAVENYKSFVYVRLYLWSETPVEKVYVNQLYRAFLQQMEEEKEKLHKGSRLLETLQKDHHLLAFERKKSGFRETEAEIAADIIQINRLIEEIIRLTQ